MPDRFDEFWTIAPRKRGKGAARKAYAKALTIADEDEILTGTRRWRQESIGKDPAFICHPATWLNQERWEDEPDAPIVATGNAWAIRAHNIKAGMSEHPAVIKGCLDRGLITAEEAGL